MALYGLWLFLIQSEGDVYTNTNKLSIKRRLKIFDLHLFLLKFMLGNDLKVILAAYYHVPSVGVFVNWYSKQTVTP